MTSTSDKMGEGLLELGRHMSPRRRWQALGILAFMLVGAFAELVTIGAVIPFLALISDPQAGNSHPLIRQALAIFGWSGSASLIVPAAVFFCAVAVAAAAIRIALTWASQKFVFRLGYDLSVAVYEGMLYQPYSFHVMHNTSEILSGLGKVQNVLKTTLLPLMLGLTSLLIALFIFGALLFLSTSIAVVSALGFSLIYIVVAVVTRSRLRRNSVIIARSGTERLKTVQEGLGGIRDVLIDHAQRVYLKKFKHSDKELRDSQATNALIAATPRFVVEGAGMVFIAILALMMSSQAGGIAGALPMLGALALGAHRLLPLLQQIYNSWAQIAGGRQTLLDVLALLEKRRVVDVASHAPAPPISFASSIALRHVSFRYDQGPLVLKDIHLEIPKGGRIAFIGKTGSGKSTIMDLILGLLDPTEGEISVDGIPMRECRAGWQSQIAHVPQAIYLSDTSIAENIAFGVERHQIDTDRLHEAARKADIHDFIVGLEKGYDTQIGERGIRLSGGQRQRIGIARALYKRSKVLVFDEATSALDDATEAAVMEAIGRLGRDLTVLIIAHRLTTVKNCDTIYRLSNGRIVASGTFDQVMSDASAGEAQRVRRA